jgi:hypothetical protein
MYFRKASFLAAAFIGSGCLVQHGLRFVVHRRDRFVLQAEERHIKIDPSNDVAKNRFDNNNKKQKRKSCVIVVGTTGKTLKNYESSLISVCVKYREVFFN